MKPFLLIVMTLCPLLLFSQGRVCGTEEYSKLYKYRDTITSTATPSNLRIATYISPDSIIRVPVVVHVIHNNTSGTIGGANNPNISDDQVISQITVLNEDYRKKYGTNGYNDSPIGADVGIEFFLATIDPNGNPTTGIDRVYNSTSYWTINQDAQIKGLSDWPSDQYLNIWVANLENGYLGWTQFPDAPNYPGLVGPYTANTDGVVIHYQAFGRTGAVVSPYNLGRTGTHETGHWFGLLHIWGNHTGYPCGTDYVNDTPPDEGPNDDYDCADSSDCNNDGHYTQDLTNDYLDYSPDACMNIFTQGQKARMRGVIQEDARRSALLSSPAARVAVTTGITSAVVRNAAIFPNPATDRISVVLPTSIIGEATIIDAFNRPVQKASINDTRLEMDISSLTPGFYFLILEANGNRSSFKIVKN